MTYSPSHGSYPSYPIRYAFSNQQQQQQQQQQQGQPQQPQPTNAQAAAAAHHHHSSQHTPTHYPKPSYAHHPQLHHSQIPIKVEESADLPPVSSLTGYDHHHVKSSSLPIFRFGTEFGSSASPTSPSTPFTFMSHQNWPTSGSGSGSSSYAHQQHHAHAHPHSQQQYAAAVDRYALPSPVNGQNDQHALSLADDYDDEGGDELGDLPGASMGGMGLPYSAGGSSLSAKAAAEKQIRRRSSKACDQCRKSKCKCERSSPQEPCRNCVMLGTRESLSLYLLPACVRVFVPFQYEFEFVCTLQIHPTRTPQPTDVVFDRMYLPRPFAQAWTSKGIHRRDRGAPASNGSAHRNTLEQQR